MPTNPSHCICGLPTDRSLLIAARRKSAVESSDGCLVVEEGEEDEDAGWGLDSRFFFLKADSSLPEKERIR